MGKGTVRKLLMHGIVVIGIALLILPFYFGVGLPISDITSELLPGYVVLWFGLLFEFFGTFKFNIIKAIIYATVIIGVVAYIL